MTRTSKPTSTRRFKGAHHDAAVQANRMLERLREQTKAAHNLWDTWNRGRATMDQLTRALDECGTQARCWRHARATMPAWRARSPKSRPASLIADETGTIVSVNQALAATLREVGDDLAPAHCGIEAIQCSAATSTCSMPIRFADGARGWPTSRSNAPPCAWERTSSN
jgi:hypothetical protein